MSRSKYIYVITDVSGDLLTAFTVKREMLQWINEQEGNALWTLWRVCDSLNGRSCTNLGTMRELAEKAGTR